VRPGEPYGELHALLATFSMEDARAEFDASYPGWTFP
jgi:hypothetical protein